MPYNIEPLVTDYQSGGKNNIRPDKPSNFKRTYKDKNGSDYVIDPGTPAWYKKQAEWLWWMFANNYTDLNYSTRLEMMNLRQYAAGRQPVEKYLGPWRRWDKKNNRWITWANISFDIYAIVPKFVSWVRGVMNNIDFAIQAKCVDETAGTEREEIIAKQEVLEKDKQFYQAANALLGNQSPDPQQPLPFIPQNKEQAQMLSDMGFIKLTSEAELEELLVQSAEESRWNETIKPRLEEDGFVLSRMWTKAYTDPVTKRITSRYADPENMIVRYLKMDRYYQKINYAAEIIPYTIGDLRAKGVSPDELIECVKYYANKIGNPATNYTGTWTNGMYFNPMWNDFIVYAIDMEFESVDFRGHKWVEFDQKTGEWIPSSEDRPGAMPQDADEISDHIPMSQYPKWHQCEWIIGTKIVTRCGFQHDVPYDQENRPQSTYSGVLISDRSAVSIVIPDADDVQNLTLKYRAAIAKMRPPGIIIDKNAWQETELGGQKFTWLDQLNAFNQTGDGVVQNPVTLIGQSIPGVPPPFYENKGTIGVLADYQAARDGIIARMADKIGIPLPLEGSAPDPNMPVGTTQIALAGSNNVLRPIVMAYQSVKKQTFSKMAYMYEIRSKNSLLENYEGIIGHDGVDLMKFINQFHHGIFVDAMTDTDTKRDLLESMKLSLQAAKTGGVGITDAEYFATKRLIDQGLYKSAELYLSWRDALHRKEQQDLQKQNMELNKQTMMAQEQMKQQAMGMKEQSQRETKLLIEKADLEKQLAVLSAKFNNDRVLNQETGQIDLHNTALQGNIDEELIGVQADADIKVAKAAPKPKATK